MDLETLEMVRSTFRALLSSHPPAESLSALLDAGLSELVEEDPASAWGALFEAQGSQNVRSPALDLVFLDAVGWPIGDDRAVVWPSPSRSLQHSCRIDATTLRIDGLVLAGAERATEFVVPALDGHTATLVRIPASAIETTAMCGIDPSWGASTVTMVIDVPVQSVPLDRPWESVIAAVQRCLSHELIGVAEESLAVACAHVSERRQFDHPIGTFQSVKHRLADVLVATTAAKRAVGAAWTDDDPCATWASKALAARAALLAGRHGLQVCGATGYLSDHPVQRLMRRAIVLDALLGSESWLGTAIGREILARGRVPRVPALVMPSESAGAHVPSNGPVNATAQR